MSYAKNEDLVEDEAYTCFFFLIGWENTGKVS